MKLRSEAEYDRLKSAYRNGYNAGKADAMQSAAPTQAPMQPSELLSLWCSECEDAAGTVISGAKFLLMSEESLIAIGSAIEALAAPTQAVGEAVGYMHKYRKIRGGARYTELNHGESRECQDPREGYEWYGSEPVFLTAAPAAAVEPKDGCELCRGERGGVPGNENRINGKLVCDYCHSDMMRAAAAPEGLTPCRHEAFQGRCVHCDVSFVNGKPTPATPDAKAAADGMTDAQIYAWWESENGLEDCDMCKRDDFRAVVRAVEKKLASIATQEGGR